MSDLYKEEIEELTGKIYRGDLTPLVYDLLKESLDLDALLVYLNSKEPVEKEKITIEQPEAAPSFDSWFSNFPTVE